MNVSLWPWSLVVMALRHLPKESFNFQFSYIFSSPLLFLSLFFFSLQEVIIFSFTCSNILTCFISHNYFCLAIYLTRVLLLFTFVICRVLEAICLFFFHFVVQIYNLADRTMLRENPSRPMETH
jgi:hypothetical protein